MLNLRYLQRKTFYRQIQIQKKTNSMRTMYQKFQKKQCENVFCKKFYEFKRCIEIFIEIHNRRKISDCSNSCFDELFARQKCTIQIFRSHYQFHVKHFQNRCQIVVVVSKIANFAFEIFFCRFEKQCRATRIRSKIQRQT